MILRKAKLVFVDVETTGLSPAMGDRIVVLGMVVCQPGQKTLQASQLINPSRPIPRDARRIHGIGDDDVTESPTFDAVAGKMCSILHGAWLVGHNIRFDVGFLAMEFAMAGLCVEPLGCLDTCQLATAAWELPDYKLDTITAHLRIERAMSHRALDDAAATKKVFDLLVDELGDASTVSVAELLSLHRYQPTWPAHPQSLLPGPLYDALTSGRLISIGYVNGDGKTSTRMIRPYACFPAGRHVYVKAYCTEAAEMRMFRIDRIVEAADPTAA